jgi:nicotinate-nucleotide adenylyltransferase
VVEIVVSEIVSAIGVFGGTFDPVHHGHLRAAIEAKEKLGLEDLRLLPAGTPPHRTGTYASAEHRLAMLRLALGNKSKLRVDEREVRRDGSSFMVDTLAEIRVDHPDTPLLLMIGQDAANALDQWHEWRSLFDLAHLVIMRRPDSVTVYSDRLNACIQPRLVGQVAALNIVNAGKVLPLELTQLAISSTDIRRRISEGKSTRFLLPDAVISHIRINDLYRDI